MELRDTRFMHVQKLGILSHGYALLIVKADDLALAPL